MLGKMIQVTKGCTFTGDLLEALTEAPLEVKEVYWEKEGKTAVGVAPLYRKAVGGDGLWCVIYPDGCHIVEEH